MKRTLLTIAIVLGLGMFSFADPNGGGLYQRGFVPDEDYHNTGWNRTSPLMPTLPYHGETNNQNAPLGTGIVVLSAFGAAYLVTKRRKQE